MTRIACLLPVRNGAKDLPDWFESVERFADLVLALDDGSTDSTRQLLEDHPLVAEVLTNPIRDGYEGWDDAANRQRLLDATARFDLDWIFWLDADERLDADDAAALREFLETDALAGCAYGFELHRMWGDLQSLADYSWVYRCFAPGQDQVLPDRTLHFNPIPTAIPKATWIRTTVRIRHLDSPDRLAERASKYDLTDPDRSYEPHKAWLMEEAAENKLVEWGPRDPSLAVLNPDRVSARVLDGSRRPTGSREGRIACLLPVRNGADELPGWFESVERFADLILALDDGSTDSTRELLDAHPLVAEVLSNPVREGYEGWDDAANRQRLLDAAVGYNVDWIFWLDADERIESDDAAALRKLCAELAAPQRAYGFRVFRLIDDEDHFDLADFWAFRLFAFEAGQRLPSGSLHALPIPESIGPERFVRTTIRIKHRASMDEDRRTARAEKYQRVDPQREFQADYSNLLAPAGAVRKWQPRAIGMPLLAGLGRTADQLDPNDEELDLDGPTLSAIIIARDDAATIEESVRAVLDQDVPGGHETIVVVSGSPETAAIVREKAPDALLIELAEPVLPGAARNAGLRIARGDFISFPGSHVVITPGSLAKRVAAHELGYPMVTGSILNGTPTKAGWATYLLDHFSSMPQRPSGILNGPPGHCSYGRDFVLGVGGFPEDLRAGEDTAVNVELYARGCRAYRASELVLTHRSRCTTLRRLLRHHFTRGRAMTMLLRERSASSRIDLARRERRQFSPSYLTRRMSAIRSAVARWGAENRAEFNRAMPYVRLGAFAAWVGMWVEWARPSR